MFFILVTFLSAFLIESIGTFISVIGLSAMFAANPIIMTMAITLDIAKLVVVSFLYKRWKEIQILMKSYLTVAAIILMIITSSGAFAYLSSSFQAAVLPSKEINTKLESLQKERTKLELRKKEIDNQIAQLPPNFVKGRKQLIASFKDETSHINKRLIELDAEIPQIENKDLNTKAHVGPIMYIAEAFNISIEEAIKYVILMIIFVFDPLAVMLIIAGNFLIDKRKEEKVKIEKEKKLEDIENRKFNQEIEKEKLAIIKEQKIIEEKEIDLEKAIVETENKESISEIKPKRKYTKRKNKNRSNDTAIIDGDIIEKVDNELDNIKPELIINSEKEVPNRIVEISDNNEVLETNEVASEEQHEKVIFKSLLDDIVVKPGSEAEILDSNWSSPKVSNIYTSKDFIDIG